MSGALEKLQFCASWLCSRLHTHLSPVCLLDQIHLAAILENSIFHCIDNWLDMIHLSRSSCPSGLERYWKPEFKQLRTA